MLQGLSPKPLSMWKHPLRKASLRTHRKTPQPDLPTRSHGVSGASFPTPWLRVARPEIATFLAAIFEVTFFATILRQSWHRCSLCLWFRLWCCSRCFCFHFGLWFGQSLRFCLRCCCLNSNRRLRSSCFTCFWMVRRICRLDSNPRSCRPLSKNWCLMKFWAIMMVAMSFGSLRRGLIQDSPFPFHLTRHFTVALLLLGVANKNFFWPFWSEILPSHFSWRSLQCHLMLPESI